MGRPPTSNVFGGPSPKSPQMDIGFAAPAAVAVLSLRLSESLCVSLVSSLCLFCSVNRAYASTIAFLFVCLAFFRRAPWRSYSHSLCVFFRHWVHAPPSVLLYRASFFVRTHLEIERLIGLGLIADAVGDSAALCRRNSKAERDSGLAADQLLSEFNAPVRWDTL